MISGLPIIREMKCFCFLAIACLLLAPAPAWSQDEGEDWEYDWSLVPPDEEGAEPLPAATPEFLTYADTDSSQVGEGSSGLPRSFRGIFLGIGLEELKEAVRKDSIFYFREDRDVSFLPSDQEQTLVETQGLSFIRRAFFQLRYGEVFIMSFTLDTAMVDHYSVFTAFVNRYGDPTSLNPQEAVWETDTTRVSIERPLTVKYIDKYNFEMFRRSPEAILISPSADSAREMLNRSEFLEGF